MDDSNKKLHAHLELGKDCLLDQQAANKEFTTKATGVIAFSTGLLVLARDVLSWGNVSTWTTMACFTVVTVLALVMILRARSWYTPHKLSESEQDVKDSEVGYEEFLIRIAQTCREATEKNKKTLASKAKVLDYMVYAVLAQLGSAIWLFTSGRAQ